MSKDSTNTWMELLVSNKLTIIFCFRLFCGQQEKMTSYYICLFIFSLSNRIPSGRVAIESSLTGLGIIWLKFDSIAFRQSLSSTSWEIAYSILSSRYERLTLTRFK